VRVHYKSTVNFYDAATGNRSTRVFFESTRTAISPEGPIPAVMIGITCSPEKAEEYQRGREFVLDLNRVVSDSVGEFSFPSASVTGAG